MKAYTGRILVVLSLLFLWVYFLYPTYLDSQSTKEIKKQVETFKDSLKKANPELTKSELTSYVNAKENEIFTSNPDYAKNREKRLKLGLDLQGGMYIVLEVNTAKMLEKQAKNPDDVFMKLLKESENQSKFTDENIFSILTGKLEANNIRLSRYFGTIRQSDSEIREEIEKQEADAVTRAMEIIRNRIDQYGVAEPSIQRQGTRRIIVELPGVAKEDEAKRLLQGSALLEFKMVKDPQLAMTVSGLIDQVLSAKDTASFMADSLIKNLPEEQKLAQIKLKYPFSSLAVMTQSGDAYVNEADKNKVLGILELPEVKNIIPGNVEFIVSAKPVTMENKKFYTLYLVNKNSEITGGVVTNAFAYLDPSTGSPKVSMTMNSEGAIEWARITGANIGKRCAVVLDGQVYTAPVIQSKIPSGQSEISGSDNMDEAKLLEIVLKAGALPAPVDIIEERIVGPSLGQDSVSAGLNSAIYGYILVAFFMILYYKKQGAIADIALIFVILTIMGVLAAFSATLTLPGIAGIVLTMGMAVDANVLIFERIHEERRTGKTLKSAIDSGFKHSMSAIVDSNITSLITASILFYIGTGPIKGFALTLIVGIFASLFGALFLTRFIMNFLVEKGYNIEVGNRARMFDNLNIDWIGKRKIMYGISAVMILISLISFGVRGFEYGIDFRGGSEIALKFEKPIDIAKIREQLGNIGIGKIEIKTFGSETGVLVRTDQQTIPAEIFPKVVEEIEAVIKSGSPDASYKITERTDNAVVMKFDSVSAASDVSALLFEQGFQSSINSADESQSSINVRVNIAEWVKIKLKEYYPNNDFSLAKEEQVGPKIGNELKEQAVMAVVLSLLGIMIYLGIRFKFNFSVGAVIALAHDVIITLGLFSLLYGLFDALNLEISTSVVAGFLTLVGYSINDTVVVFDRVRENLKIHKTADLKDNFNAAINRTMSRTIITGLTTLLAVFILLIMGGDILRGFSFCMFAGIIIGTYSSVFVASAFVIEYLIKSKKKVVF